MEQMQGDCQGHEMLVCLNALSSDKLKNRSFVVLAAMESTPQTDLLSVPFV